MLFRSEPRGDGIEQGAILEAGTRRPQRSAFEAACLHRAAMREPPRIAQRLSEQGLRVNGQAYVPVRRLTD